MTRREMIDAILALQRDLAETMHELGDVRYRLWRVEQARGAERPNSTGRPGRFGTAYGDGWEQECRAYMDGLKGSGHE